MMDNDFEDRILVRLRPLDNITTRAMFGGHGLYWRDVIFGILYRVKLYLKVDDPSKPDYLSRGMEPFRPNERQTLIVLRGAPGVLTTLRRCCHGPPKPSGRRNPKVPSRA